MLPGSDRPCEVMLAKNQGKCGQDPIRGEPMGQAPHVVPPPFGGYGGGAALSQPGPPGQPPPPSTPPPAHLTPWRQYHTAAGLPYYHNHKTGVTTWETPPELQ